ncbi:MAG: phage baseplate protein [Phormidesmis sp.]
MASSTDSPVQPLSAEQMVRLWEIGQRQRPIDRALTFLLFGCRGASWETLAGLSIGQRDASLLLLRERTFGPRLDSLATCPACQEKLEFTLSTIDLRVEQGRTPVHHFQSEGLSIQFRLPNSTDLAAIAPVSDPAAARQKLARRCVLQAHEGDQALDFEVLPERAIAQLNQQLIAADPQAEILLDLTCPACGHQWQTLFDIARYFWTELAAQAQRLLSEVHQLATAYGWREADILALSSTRRQYYLELVR